MLPITYENQCRACHPLDVEPEPNAPAGAARKFTVRHGLQPDELHDSLEQALVARVLAGRPHLLEQPAPGSRMPDKALGPEAAQARKLVDEEVFKAEKILYLGKQTCSECHRYELPQPREMIELIAPGERPKFQVKPSAIKEVWFEHAVFDHAAHRALSCRECHAGAFPDAQAGGSTRSRDVLLPSIRTCRQCHVPSRLAYGGTQGGAGFDCTECHRYHNGDAPLQGVGAARRDSGRDHAINQFLTSPHASPSARSQ